MGGLLSCYAPSCPVVAKKFKVTVMPAFDDDVMVYEPIETASLFGNKPTLVWEKFGASAKPTQAEPTRETTYLYSRYGDMVAKRVRSFLPSKLSQHWKIKIVPKPATAANSKLHHSLCSPEGTTALTLAKIGEDLVIGEFEEATAVLEMRGANKALVPVQLTVEEGELLILGTNNAWEVLSDENMATLMAGCTETSCVARAIVSVASGRWGYKYQFKTRDDPQVVCLFLSSHHTDIGGSIPRNHACSQKKEFVERRWR